MKFIVGSFRNSFCQGRALKRMAKLINAIFEHRTFIANSRRKPLALIPNGESEIIAGVVNRDRDHLAQHANIAQTILVLMTSMAGQLPSLAVGYGKLNAGPVALRGQLGSAHRFAIIWQFIVFHAQAVFALPTTLDT